MTQPIWFDAHLDLAYLAADGRDMDASAYATLGPPAAVTFPALAQGNVRRVLGTLFIQRRIVQGENAVDGPWCYSTPDEAFTAAMSQIQTYQLWQSQSKIQIITQGSQLQSSESSLQAASPLRSESSLQGASPRRSEFSLQAASSPLQLILLMEGAAPIRTLADLQTFHAAGVRAISLTWAQGTKWSGGNDAPGDITPAGRQLVAEIDRLKMIHDVSHLSEQAFYTLLQISSGPKIASHSNCRALLPGRQKNERNLTDAQISTLVAAGGIIGLNLFTNFLAVGRRATIADALAHIQHITQLTSRDDILGLGSDMDGGFLPSALPIGLEHPRKLHRLAEALSDANFSDDFINNFTFNNWSRFFNRALA